MTDRQLLFDLPSRASMSRADFFPAPSNQAALTAIGDWTQWPGGRLLLTGPSGSGRSHLLNIWISEVGATPVSVVDLCDNRFRPDNHQTGFAVDDADGVAGSVEGEEALFHLYNHATNRGLPLLLTARGPAGTWQLGLPDLLSRMQACPTTAVQAPDDALLGMVLVKLCDDRQLAIGGETVTYLVPRMERSLRAAHAIVAALDHTAVQRQRKVSRALAAQVLSDLDSGRDPG